MKGKMNGNKGYWPSAVLLTEDNTSIVTYCYFTLIFYERIIIFVHIISRDMGYKYYKKVSICVIMIVALRLNQCERDQFPNFHRLVSLNFPFQCIECWYVK